MMPLQINMGIRSEERIERVMEVNRELVSTNTSLDKAFKILEYLAKRGTPQSVPQISRTLKLNKTTTYSLLRTMEVHNYIVKHLDGKYSLTSKMYELGYLYCSCNPVSHIFELCVVPTLSKYPACNISLGTFGSYFSGVYLSVQGKNSTYISAGSAFPLHATAVGKILLAFSNEEYVEEFLKNAKLTRFTDKTTSERAGLERQLVRIREQGYCYLEGELYSDFYCIAVPVFGADKKIAASVSARSSQEFVESNFDKLREDMLDLGRRISYSLGYPPDATYPISGWEYK